MNFKNFFNWCISGFVVGGAFITGCGGYQDAQDANAEIGSTEEAFSVQNGGYGVWASSGSGTLSPLFSGAACLPTGSMPADAPCLVPNFLHESTMHTVNWCLNPTDPASVQQDEQLGGFGAQNLLNAAFQASAIPFRFAFVQPHFGCNVWVGWDGEFSGIGNINWSSHMSVPLNQLAPAGYKTMIESPASNGIYLGWENGADFDQQHGVTSDGNLNGGPLVVYLGTTSLHNLSNATGRNFQDINLAAWENIFMKAIGIGSQKVNTTAFSSESILPLPKQSMTPHEICLIDSLVNSNAGHITFLTNHCN